MRVLIRALCLGLALHSAAVAADAYEPPFNPYLADSLWPMTHRNNYAQASSPFAGPQSAAGLGKTQFRATDLLNATLAFSAPLDDGSRLAWGSSLSYVYKLHATPTGFRVIDKAKKPDSGNLANATTGAYTLLDKDQVFFVPGPGKLYAYQSAAPSETDSPIQLRNEFLLPEATLRGGAKRDPIVGLNLTYDGYLALATKRGTVMVVSRDFSSYHYLQLGDAMGEEVSNSIAVDEQGGIYVVTGEAMYRVQWTGSELTLNEQAGAWRARYENGGSVQVPGRLGSGSGSTPTLMGTGDQDQFVVITDGQPLTHLVLFWRNAIPADWQPIAPGKERRIAAEVPVNFGDAEAQTSMSEQSVLVRGYGAVVVNNDYRVTAQSSMPWLANLINGFVVLNSNKTRYAPYGVQKFEWNPATRTLDVAWSNPGISCPNGIPTMSAATGLFYCIGQRDAVWNVEALDWQTGASVFYKPISRWFIHNSFYAATEIGPFQDIWSGTFVGAMQVKSTGL